MATKTEERARSPWLSGPGTDLIVGCGAWSAPLLLLLYPIGQRYDLGVAFAFYALSIFCNYPHYMATIHRSYRTRGEFSKYRVFTLYVTVLLLAVAATVHFAPWLLPVFFTVFITWSPWHYTGQNFGIAMLFARRAGAEPSRAERNWLYTAFASSYGMIFLAIHAGPSTEPYIASLGLPVAASNIARLLLLLVFAGAALRGLMPMIFRAGARAMLAPITVVSTQFLWFVLPAMLELGAGWQVPRTSYSVGVLAFMHCAQYLWITRYYARRESESDGKTGSGSWNGWRYYLALVVGGIALFIPGPWIVSYSVGYDFSATFLIFTALVNIHHFVVDGAIWKLRDGRVARLLIGVGPGSGQSGDHWKPWQFFVNHAAALRVGRIAVIGALFAIAGIDQARFFFSLDRTNLTGLLSAERLNPFDVVVRTGIARVKADSGNVEGAIDELRTAIAIDPFNALAQRMLAQVLIENQRYDEAYEHHAAMASYVPLDAATLVNFGTLAKRKDRAGEAIDCWTRAIALDGSQPLPHLYLADALAEQGNDDGAIPHYERYIALAPGQRAILDRSGFLAVLQRTGDACGRVRQYERSEFYYSRMLALSKQAGDSAHEAEAEGRLGALFEATGKTAAAAAHYQRAIRVDETASNTSGLAIGWLAYARFLRNVEAPPRMATVALLKARYYLAKTPDPDFTFVDRELTAVRQSFPDDVQAVQRDIDNAANEALAFAP